LSLILAVSNSTAFMYLWTKFAKLFILADQKAVCVSVCLDVNQGGTHHNLCTQKPVILYAQSY